MIIVGTLTPTVQKQLMHTRVSRAARAAAAALYLAQARAPRQRQPVTVIVDSLQKMVLLTSVNAAHTGVDTLQRRYYGLQGEFKLPSIWGSPGSIVVFPNGMSNASITVSMSDGTITRQVKMSRAGQILVLHS